MAIGGHGDKPRLEPPPFAGVDAYLFSINRIAKYRLDERRFPRRQPPARCVCAEHLSGGPLSNRFALIWDGAVNLLHHRVDQDAVAV